MTDSLDAGWIFLAYFRTEYRRQSELAWEKEVNLVIKAMKSIRLTGRIDSYCRIVRGDL